MLFGSSCPVCGTPGRVPCRSCEASLAPPPSLALPPGLDAVSAICDYDDAGRALVHALKFRNSRATAKWAADQLAGRLAAPRAQLMPDRWALTWAPTSPARQRDRGFDQAERLARLIGRRVGVRPRRLLSRANDVPQTGRPAEDRWMGPHFTSVRRPVPSSIVVVDDVLTTGATASAAARALRADGACHVAFVTIARTAFKPRRASADESVQCR